MKIVHFEIITLIKKTSCMIQESFSDKSKRRKIIIRITDELILFFYEDNYFRELNWIKEETERRLEYGEPELEDEEAEPNEFYGVEKDRWIDARELFPSHMMEKAWFTGHMLDFVNKNIK